MSATGHKKPTVEDLRREIDTIDREIQTLIERRADVVVAIGKAKKSGAAAQPGNAMRPGREAQIIRQVVARHKGALPVGVLTGLWRGIVSAFLRMQYPFTVHVSTGPGAAAKAGFSLWDLARVHFGPATPLEYAATAADVIAKVTSDPHAVGVIPANDHSGWWAHLPAAGPGSPRIVALLPFVEIGRHNPAAYVIACADREESGEDMTLLRLSGAAASLVDEVAKALNADVIAHHGKAGHSAALLLAPGYLTIASPQISAFRGLWTGLDIIGGYAAPIRLKDDAHS